MIRIEKRVQMHAPADNIFAVVTDIDRTPHWVSMVKRVQRTSDGGVGIGTTFVETSELMGQRAEIGKVVSAYDPARTYAVKSTSGPIAHTITVQLTQEGDSTTVGMVLEAEEPGGMMSLLGGVIRSMVEEQITGDLARLKQLVEGR